MNFHRAQLSTVDYSRNYLFKPLVPISPKVPPPGTPIRPHETLTLNRVKHAGSLLCDRLQGHPSSESVIPLLEHTLENLKSGNLVAKPLRSHLHWRIYEMLQDQSKIEMMSCFKPEEVLCLFHVCGIRDKWSIERLLLEQITQGISSPVILSALLAGARLRV